MKLNDTGSLDELRPAPDKRPEEAAAEAGATTDPAAALGALHGKHG